MSDTRLVAAKRQTENPPEAPLQNRSRWDTAPARHRRLERRLIGEYEATLDELLDGLSAENRDLAVEIASLPEYIRGFDTVKESQLAETRAKQAELLDAFRRRVA